ncbi:MAG TPA: RNA-binding S4 domain-containing protein [Lacunisphaera sp.]|nr:RNA-binding S4 domain-containing protein [Lacunisphaera sp.]
MPDSSSTDPAKAEPIVVREVPIELCQFVKFAGMTGTGGEAKQLIGAGQVTVNGSVEIRKRRKLVAGDVVSHGGRAAVVRVGA